MTRNWNEVIQDTFGTKIDDEPERMSFKDWLAVELWGKSEEYQGIFLTCLKSILDYLENKREG